MIIYKCCITGDEMFSDAYNIKDFHEFFYEVEAKFITESCAGIHEIPIVGDEESAEGPDKNAAASQCAENGPNVALNNKYVEKKFGSKKEFTVAVRTFLKRVIDYKTRKAAEARTEFDSKAFGTAHNKAVGNVLLPLFNAGQLRIYMGESRDPDATLAMLTWRKQDGSDEKTPFFLYFKCGLVTEKC